MMENQYGILKVTENDLDDISSQIVDMVQESEGKVVHKAEIQSSIDLLLENERLGAYYKHKSEEGSEVKSLGSFLITWEWNLYEDCYDWWFQSVYVLKQHRRAGVFKNMFQFIEQQAFSLKASIKLYVEVENQVAIQVYEKMGMSRSKEVVYEDDFFFYPFKGELKLDPSLTTVLADIYVIQQIVNFITQSTSIFEKQLKATINPTFQVQKLLEQTKYEGSILLTKHEEITTMMTSYFTEFSDWRKGLTIWVYDFRILNGKSNDKNLINLMVQNVLNQLKQLKIKLNVGCIRFMFDEEQCPMMKEIMESIGLIRSHYYIYYKSLQNN